MVRLFAISSIFIGLGLATASGCTPIKTETPNTLHIGSDVKIKGLDPAAASDIYSSTEISRVYEGLLQYHYLKRPFVLVPNLAESMPHASEDGTTYVIKIKKGVLFQDDPCFKDTGGKGRELTSEDFVYSWKRLADPKTISQGWWIFDGKIVGLNQWHDEAIKTGQADYAKPVEGIQALDRYTLQIKLIRRSAQFLFHLTQPFSFVVPREAIETYDKEFLFHAVGTGPFRLQEFNGASKIIWVRNPTYRKDLYPSEGNTTDPTAGLLEDAGKPLPFLDKIVVQVFEERQPMWLTFLSGKLDHAVIPKDNYAEVIGPNKELKEEYKAKKLKLVKFPEYDVTHLSFNMADPLFGKNKLLRQALSLAYDSETSIQLFLNGRGIPAQGPIPPGIPGYDENIKNPYRQTNIVKAKELLAKAGYPNGKGLPPIEYLAQADSTNRQSAEYDQKQFAAIGIRLKINSYSWPEFQTAIKNRRGQMWLYAWSADYPDAENFLQLFYSKNVSPGSNDASYSNPEFDKLYESSLTLLDSPERTALYKKMVQIVIEDCPWIFHAHRIGSALVQPWVKNFKPRDFDVGRTKYLRIDVAEATKRK
ncbi:ABC transporter substrate-binding protein [Bdellovibrionota bacterium FG-1]